MNDGRSDRNADLELQPDLSSDGVAAEFVELFRPLFRPPGPDETILPRDETIFRFRRRCPETAGGYQVPNETAGAAGHG